MYSIVAWRLHYNVFLHLKSVGVNHRHRCVYISRLFLNGSANRIERKERERRKRKKRERKKKERKKKEKRERRKRRERKRERRERKREAKEKKYNQQYKTKEQLKHKYK